MTESPMTLPATWGSIAEAYENEVAPNFEFFAHEAMQLSGLEPGMRILDVACGPGTLSLMAAQRGARVTGLDFAEPMIERARLRSTSANLEVEWRVGDGMNLPFEEGQFFAGFSMFGLMFFPDRHRGWRELHRVVGSGGKVVISSWQPWENVPQLHIANQVVCELTNQPAPSIPAPLSDRTSCEQEVRDAGFVDVSAHELERTADFESTEAMLSTWWRSCAPYALLRRSMSAEQGQSMHRGLVSRLEKELGAGPQRMPLRAILTVGTRP